MSIGAVQRRVIAALLALVSPLVGGTGVASSLGGSLGLSGNAQYARVAYCPGNSCEVFYLRGKDARATLEVFAAAYFYGVSEFVELRRFQDEEPPEWVASALSRYGQVCAQTWARTAAQCVATYLATSRPIQGRFVHFEEGRRIVVPFAPAQTIGRARHDA